MSTADRKMSDRKMRQEAIREPIFSFLAFLHFPVLHFSVIVDPHPLPKHQATSIKSQTSPKHEFRMLETPLRRRCLVH
jgi:hypothetical protein